MKRDQKAFTLLEKEEARQVRVLNLIASENYVSREVREALGSVFTNKYSEGYPGKRYYGGNEVVDEVETLAQERACKLFGLSPKIWHVNVQPYSGSPANLAVYAALVPIGGTIMGLELSMGGHLTHGYKVSFTSKAWNAVQYVVDPKTHRLDYAAITSLARRYRPSIIVAGYTAYPRIINFREFRRIADSVSAALMVDMSHIAGLVAGKAYPSPFGYADVVTTTTHKTLRGPRGAMIFARASHARAIDRAVFPGLQGGPHDHQTLAIAVSLWEAMQPGFRRYAKQIVKNAQTLAMELKRAGWPIITGGTDSHVLLVDVASRGIGGAEAEKLLEDVGIIVNKNTIPYDTRPAQDPSGIRLGTAALTTRGMKEREMRIVASLIDRALKRVETREITRAVHDLTTRFVIP